MNTPHNPTGKIFSQQEIDRLSDILQSYPNVIVIEDGVYEHITYGQYKPFFYPRIANCKNMQGDFG